MSVSLPVIGARQAIGVAHGPALYRAGRIGAVVATGLLLLFAAAQTVAIFGGAMVRGDVGFDANLYATIGRHFLETGQAYFPVQMEPYVAAGTVNLYPPTALYLFIPASFAPRILWWIIPLAIIAWSLYRLRPGVWAWPVMAAACVLPLNGPHIPVGLVYGNSMMWTLAAMFAASTVRPGVAWAILLKPTQILFALPWALRSWRGLAVVVSLSAVMLPLWFAWLEAMANLQHGSAWLEVSPALAIPLIAYLARSRPSRSVNLSLATGIPLLARVRATT